MQAQARPSTKPGAASFSAKALLPTDPPSFSDDAGKVSVDW